MCFLVKFDFDCKFQKFFFQDTNFLFSKSFRDTNKRQPHKMVKHTKTIRRLLPATFLSVFDRFVGLALKGLNLFYWIKMRVMNWSVLLFSYPTTIFHLLLIFFFFTFFFQFQIVSKIYRSEGIHVFLKNKIYYFTGPIIVTICFFPVQGSEM